jgi:cysteine desulfurase
VLYFDHNATSPACAVARQAWAEALDRFPANPSSPHRMGARAESALEEARHRAATLLGCSPAQLIWTTGATESNNALFHHAAQASPGEVWLSAVEHPSALAAARRWFAGRLRIIPVSPAGVVDLDWVAAQLSHDRPALVAIMAANNETGVLQPWREALALCRRHGVPFACDAAQWVGRLPAAGLGECDYASGCAHKFGGVPGAGFLRVPGGFQPFLVGGQQEDGRRAGTENLPAIHAMVATWSERERQIAGGEVGDRTRWRDEFIRSLEASLPGWQLLGGPAPRLWNTVSGLMPVSGDCRRRWVVQLDRLGFAVSTGSACASGREEPSHVLLAMIGPDAPGDRMLRFSAGWDTTATDWEALRDGILVAHENLNNRAVPLRSGSVDES